MKKIIIALVLVSMFGITSAAVRPITVTPAQNAHVEDMSGKEVPAPRGGDSGSRSSSSGSSYKSRCFRGNIVACYKELARLQVLLANLKNERN